MKGALPDLSIGHDGDDAGVTSGVARKEPPPGVGEMIVFALRCGSLPCDGAWGEDRFDAQESGELGCFASLTLHARSWEVRCDSTESSNGGDNCGDAP